MNSKKTLEFTVITDAHLYSPKLGTDTPSYMRFNAKSQKLLKESSGVIAAAFKQIAAEKSDIVLFCGDATCDGDRDSHEEFISMLTALKQCGKRVFAITSTHDYQDSGVTCRYTSDIPEEIPSVRREQLASMYADFGPNEALSVFSDGLSYIVELDGDHVLFALNSDKNGSGRSGYSPECREWISANAAKYTAEGKRLIAMTHHPIISPSPFYSLIGKNDMMSGHEEITEWLSSLGIELIFTGHSHIHDISYRFTDSGRVFYDVSTSALAGFPGLMRSVVIDGDSIRIDSREIEGPTPDGLDGDGIKALLKEQFIGMIRLTLDSAAKDIPTFAQNVSAMSIPALPVYRFGWLIKPAAKLVTSLTIGNAAAWCKKETGISPEEIAEIRDRKIVDFILDLVMHLYGGDAPYSPETCEYRITQGVLSIVDSTVRALHIPFSKLVKGFGSTAELITPLLFNSGICDRSATLRFGADREYIESITTDKQPENINSRKGPFIAALLIMILIIMLLLLPVTALVLLAAHILNHIKYREEIRRLKNE